MAGQFPKHYVCLCLEISCGFNNLKDHFIKAQLHIMKNSEKVTYSVRYLIHGAYDIH